MPSESKRQKIPANQRFKKMLRKKRGSDCIEFTGAICPNGGYGRFRENAAKREDDTIWLAHRYAYHLIHGEVPPLLRHRCHNPLCCNVAHLIPGTHIDNMADMVAAGRSGKPKLKKEQVELIAMLHIKKGQKIADLAKRYEVGHRTIANIVTGKSWSKVTGIQRQPMKPHERKRKAA